MASKYITVDKVALLHESGVVYFLDRPYRHHNIIWWMADLKVNPRRCTQGFLLSNGQFANRKRAAFVAFRCGQINECKRELYSEDLW